MKARRIHKGFRASGIALAAVFAITSSASSGTLVVRDADVTRQTAETPPTASWVGYVSGASDYQFLAGPGAPPAGVGSLQLSSSDEETLTILNHDGIGISLGEIGAMSFSTYRTTSSASAPMIMMQVDVNGDGAGGATTLLFDPGDNVSQGVLATGAWQSWDAYDGGAAIWRSSNSVPGAPVADSGVAWSDIVAANPDAVISGGFGVSQGNGSAVDALSISTITDGATTFDFEAAASAGDDDDEPPVDLDAPVTLGELLAALDAVTSNLVDGAPAELDTLRKLAASLGNDPNFAATMAAALESKQPLNADLSDIAALTPSDNDVLQRKAGVWTNTTPAGLKADLGLSKADVELDQVDNTADADKPVSTAQQAAIDSLVGDAPEELNTLEKLAAALGDDPNFADVLLPVGQQLSAIAALTPQDGHFIIRQDGEWVSRTASEAKTDLGLSSVDVGLDLVDNTADADKPVSDAQQAALDSKANAVNPTIQGSTRYAGNRQDGVLWRIDPIEPGLAPFGMNYSETWFPGGLPDPVMQWGYNINEGGGLIEAGKAGIGLQIEGNYDMGYAHYVEQHLLYVDSDGYQHRPWSWRINTAPTGAWDYMLHLSTMQLWERGDTANPFYGVGPQAMFYLPAKVGGEPASGIYMAGDSTNFIIQKAGPNPLTLNYTGWNAVSFPGVTIYGPGGNAGSVDASGWVKAQRIISRDDIYASGNLRFIPSTSAAPSVNGQLTFELTSNSTLTVKVKGSDGVIRSAVLALN